MDTNEILTTILQKLDGLETGQNETNQRLNKIEADISELHSDVSGLHSDVTELRSDVSGLQSDVTELRSDVSGVQSDVSDLRSDVSGLHSDVSELRSDVSDIKERAKGIELTLENEITRRLDSLADGYKLNGEKLDGLRDVVDDLDSTVSALDVVTKFNTDQTITLKIVK